LEALEAEGGICVLIINSPTGQMTHYLMRRFGKFIGGRQSSTRVQLPEDTQILVYSQYPDTTTFDPYENQAAIHWIEDWAALIRKIDARYGGRAIRVGVIPDGTIQYWAPPKP
jgi:hypothetical protein